MILKTGCPVHLGCLAASLAALQSQPKLAPVAAKCPPKTVALRMEVMLCTQDHLLGPQAAAPQAREEKLGAGVSRQGPGVQRGQRVRKVHSQVIYRVK